MKLTATTYSMGKTLKFEQIMSIKRYYYYILFTCIKHGKRLIYSVIVKQEYFFIL